MTQSRHIRRTPASLARIITPAPPTIEHQPWGDVIWSVELISWMRDAWNAGLPTWAVAQRVGQGVTRNQVAGIKSRNEGFELRASPIIRGGARKVTLARAPRVTLAVVEVERPAIVPVHPHSRPRLPLCFEETWDTEYPRISVAQMIREERAVPAPAAPVIQMPAVRGRCEWRDGDRPRSFVQCETRDMPGKSWCECHARRVFVRRADAA